MQCEKCQKTFKRWIKIDDKLKNMSSRKYCLECSPFKKHNTRNIEEKAKYFGDNFELPKYKICSKCNNKLHIHNFGIHKKRANRIYVFPYCKKCDSKRYILRKQELKQKAVEYKGGKCYICGYNKCLKSLDFHHRDVSKKEFEISKYQGSNFDDIKNELDKCDLLCRNCHGEAHD